MPMHRFVMLIASAAFVLGPAIAEDKNQTSANRDQTATHADKRHNKADVTYGRVKELTAGQKVVVDVDNAIDKSYDLTDKDTQVKMASSLKVGDPVKITERDVNGRKVVQITKHTGGNVAHGDKDRNTERHDADRHNADRQK